MMWGFYLWPHYDWTLRDRRQAVVRRLHDLGDHAGRVRYWMASCIDVARGDARWASRCRFRT
jgi:hypothetical protein